MRVTHGMLQRSLLQNIQRDMGRLADAQLAVATGKRVHRPSDDPVSASRSMRSTEQLRALEQYRRNTAAARTQVDAQESVMDQVTDLLTRARELAIQLGTDSATPANLQAGAAELDQIIEQVVQLGNTVIDGEHIFGGHQTLAPPFQPDGTYVGDAGIRETDIGNGYRIQTNHSGDAVFVASGVVQGLTDLRDALRSGDPAAVRAAGSPLDSAFDSVQALLAESGARARQIDVALENLDALDTNHTAARQAAEEISLEEATVEMVTIQTTLQAALASTARILEVNLTEYLR